MIRISLAMNLHSDCRWYSSGPHSFRRCSPCMNQALGWPLLLSVSGGVAAGASCCAGLYPLLRLSGSRLGLPHWSRSLRACRSLSAALLLSASVFFLAYMIHARSFTLVRSASGAIGPTGSGPAATRKGRAGGSAAGQCWPALWSHYFCALFLPVARPVSPALSSPGTGAGGNPSSCSGSLPC